MSATKTDPNPFLRRTRLRRALDGLKVLPTLPRLAYQSVRSWPLIVRQLIVIIGVVVLIWGGYEGSKFYLRRSRDKAVQQEWITIENVVKTTRDRDEILKSLGNILAINPEDMLAKSRKTALETGRIDPTDMPMISLIYSDLQKQNRIDDLIREGERRLEYEKKDYNTHAMLAKAFYQKVFEASEAKKAAEAKGDTAAVAVANAAIEKQFALLNRELDALANPGVNNVNLDFGAMTMSLEMLRHFNKNLTPIREMIAQRALPMLKAEHFQIADPTTQCTLVFLYSEIFELPNVPPDAAQYWPAASRMMELCLDGCKEKDDAGTAGRLGTLGGKLTNAIARMRASAQLTEPQRVEAAAELDDRIRRAWGIVLAKEPKNAAAHVGLVESYFRAGLNADGYNALIKGIEVVGDQPQLLQIFANLSIVIKNPLAGYARMKDAAARNPKQPLYWTLAARAALAGNRRDLASAALEEARKIAPEDVNIAAMQATIYTGTDHPHLVLQALAAIPDAKLLTTLPGAVPLFTRALTEIGDTERLDAFLKDAVEVGRKYNSPEPAFLAAKGVFEAERPTAERAQRVAEYLTVIVDRWRNELPAAALLQAQALARASESAEGTVDPVKARSAIMAIERALTQDAQNVALHASLAELHLRGDKSPKQALNDLPFLLTKVDDLSLTAHQAEVIGMIYNANQKYDDAIRVLKRYAGGKPSAGLWTQLGTAYHGQGRAAEAKDALDRASGLTMSDRERTDYKSARVLLTREKQ